MPFITGNDTAKLLHACVCHDAADRTVIFCLSIKTHC